MADANDQSDVKEHAPATSDATHQDQNSDSLNGQNTNGSTAADTSLKGTDVGADAASTAVTESNTDKVSESIEAKEEATPAAPVPSQRKSRSNIKATFDLPESNDPDEIRNQVEFYFSDSNLPIDAYLLTQTGGHKNTPIPLKTIHNFKRMQHFQPFSAVRDAIKESKFLDLDSADNVSRKVALDEKFTDDVEKNRALVHSASMARSIYAKGFGREVGSTHTEIEEFFAPYGPLRSVRLRRHADGEFKGSVFVEFEDEDTQKKFLELDPKPQWQDRDLKISSKQEYVDEKHQGILDGIVKPNSNGRGKSGRGGRDRGRGRGSRGRGSRGNNYHGRDGGRHSDKDWRERRDEDNQRRGGRGGSRGRGRDDNNKRSRDDQDGENREAKKVKEDNNE